MHRARGLFDREPHRPRDLASLPTLGHARPRIEPPHEHPRRDRARDLSPVRPAHPVTNPDHPQARPHERRVFVVRPHAPLLRPRRHLEDGSLVALCPGYTFDSDVAIYAVYPHRRHLPAKTRAFIDFLAESFGPEPYWDKPIPAK